MELTHKQEQEFIEFYKWLYGDTSEATWTWELPKIPKSKEEEHIKLWRDALTKIIWPKKAKSLYKIRPYGKQTVLDYVFSRLWMWYWPTVLNDNETNNDTNEKTNVKTDSV